MIEKGESSMINYIMYLLIGCFISLLPAGAQTNRERIYNAYISGDMELWESVIAEMETTPGLSIDEKIELINYFYGYTGFLIGNEKKAAGEFIKKGEKYINEVLKIDPQNATALAYKGSFISFKIALSKLKAVALGPESMKLINKAYRIDPTNVQALTDKGNMLYYAPKVFGGNKTESLHYFEKAILQLELNNNTVSNWNYLNLMALLNQYYMEMGYDDKALHIKVKALNFEPDFNWLNE